MTTTQVQIMKFPARCTHWQGDTWQHYQEPIYLEAMKHVTNRSLAIDLGAHVGIFTTRMERDFDEVYSFEPAADNFRCLAQNTTKARLFNCCVWSSEAKLGMRLETHHNSGANEVCGPGNYPALPLDVFNVRPGLIKMDIQGSECHALTGAIGALLAKPVLIVESYRNGAVDTELERLLDSLGYRKVVNINKDGVWVPR
jgi:hypothetical protein